MPRLAEVVLLSEDYKYYCSLHCLGDRALSAHRDLETKSFNDCIRVVDEGAGGSSSVEHVGDPGADSTVHTTPLPPKAFVAKEGKRQRKPAQVCPLRALCGGTR